MEKSPLQADRSTLPASLPIDHPVFKNYPLLTRCNSFSSTSSDSAIYYGSESIVNKPKNGKRLTSENQTGELSKRSRNSSGSSISSNMSCASDKDTNPEIASQANKSPVENGSVYSTGNLFNESNDVEDTKECAKEEIIPATNKIIQLPPRILRRHIIKKGCACCPSTHTTVLVRRYRRIFKTTETTEKKTIISRTNVKTYVQNAASTNTIQSKHENNKSSPKSSGKRNRRSEIEKLYESLHEIEWAKNFSPDNILRQINVRQAASSSAFGPGLAKTRNLERNARKQKMNNLYNGTISSRKSENLKKRTSQRTSNNNVNKTKNLRSNNRIKVYESKRKQISCSKKFESPQSFKSSDSESSVNITCSVSHVNVKNININPTESVQHSQSLLNGSDVDYCNDAQLSNVSDDSSSVASSSIVNIQSKHLLDLDYTNRINKTLSDIDISDYSATPTFFDIAEEGIRTIDACFREVGAEVVVSTCYDDSSLPLLQSVSENTDISLIPDHPPVLESYKNFRSNKNNRKFEVVKKYSLRSSSKEIEISSSKREFLGQEDVKTEAETQTIKKSCQYLVYKSNRDALLFRTARKILNKYLKQYHKPRILINKCSKLSKLIKTAKNTIDNNVNNTNECNLTSVLENENSHKEIIGNTILSNCDQTLLLTPTSSVLCDGVVTERNQYVSKVEDKVFSPVQQEDESLSCLKNGSSLFETSQSVQQGDTVITSETNTTVITTTKVQCSISETKTLVSSFVTTSAGSYKQIKESVVRPLLSAEFSSYNSIKVNKSSSYTQIILKLTRGKSIFLTVEALTELTDVVTRTGYDSNCQVLIINGIGDSFCLGVDLRPLVGPTKNFSTTETAKAVKAFIEALSNFKKPIAAVVSGPAVGLGMTLLNHADLTIASENATFCMPHSYLGYMPEGGACLTLPQAVGATVAMDLLIRGKTLTAREACTAGLITDVVESQRLPQELVSRVRTLVENSLPALETTKAILKMQLHVNLRLVLENEVKLLPRMWLTKACQDAMKKALCSGILSE